MGQIRQAKSEGLELTSESVVSECLKFHGWGEYFYRTDGLEREAERVKARQEYLNSHPKTRPENREAILNAAITPGMKKDEVTAAWGLTHMEARNIYGHVASVGWASYGFFTGFEVGERYALCMFEEVVVGVRRCEEILIKRDRELDMEVARRFLSFIQFFETKEGELGGRTVDLNNVDYDIWLHYLYGEAVFPSYSTDPHAIEEIEWEIRRSNRFSEYARALNQLGVNVETATPEERCFAAIEIADAETSPSAES